ncbi:MAG: hypothetical protein PHE53_05185 [Thermoguttaceae bacterium]|nr:hypothetical protein [Thermoguttaceae bacterium]
MNRCQYFQVEEVVDILIGLRNIGAAWIVIRTLGVGEFCDESE